MSIGLSEMSHWLRAVSLPSRDPGLWLKAADTLSRCGGTCLHALGETDTGSLGQEDLLVWPCQRLSPGSSETIPRSKARQEQEEKDQTLSTKYFLNSNDIPSIEHMARSGARAKCLKGQGTQRAITQDKVVGALHSSCER